MKMGAEGEIGQRLVRADEDHYTHSRFLRKYRLMIYLFNVLRRDMNGWSATTPWPVIITSITGYERLPSDRALPGKHKLEVAIIRDRV